MRQTTVSRGSRPAVPSEAPIARPIIIEPGNAPMMTERREFPFLIVTETNPIVVGGSSNLIDTFIVDGENAFVLETIRSTHSAAYRLLLSYGSGQGRLMNRATHVELLAGTAQRPGFWSSKGWQLPIGTRTVIQAEFQNLSTTTNTIEIALCGYRRFIDPNLERTVLTGQL